MTSAQTDSPWVARAEADGVLVVSHQGGAMESVRDERGVLANALELAKLGHPVLPCWGVRDDGTCRCPHGEACKSTGKHPLSRKGFAPNGLDDATTEADTIIGWFAQDSGKLNLGWRLDGLGVPDVDVADGKIGGQTVAELEAEHGPLTPTLTIRTGRGGLQYVYELPGVDTEQYGDSLGTNVDFKRGAGAYVMVPGSKTVDVYRIESGKLGEHEPLPQWVHEVARRNPLDQVRQRRKQQREATARAEAIDSTRLAESLAECDSKAACLNLSPGHPDRSSYDWVKKTAGYEARDARDTTARSYADYYAAMCAYDGASDHPRYDYDPEKFDEILTFVWREESTKRAEVSTNQATRELWRADTEAYKATGEYDNEANKALLRTVTQEEAQKERAAADWKPPADERAGNLADRLARERPKVPHRFEGLGKVGANTTVAAQYKAGKTTLVCNLVRSLADEVPLFGRFELNTPLSGNIAVFNYELDDDEFEDWLADQNIKHPDRVHLLHLRGEKLPLVSEPVEEWVTQWLAERDIEALIIDPAARAFSGCGDENSNQDVAAFTEAVDVIKHNAGVRDLWMPTHTGRGQEEAAERSRGATRWDDWPDVLWKLVKGDTGNRYFGAQGRKVNQAEIELSFDSGTGRLGTTGGGDRQSAAEETEVGRAVQLLRTHLSQHGECSKSQLSGQISSTKKKAERVMKLAIERGKIIEHKADKPGKPHQLSLPSS
ncbi:bifunctional DNA primase/polymerase-like protein [Haloactinospora alba]|nr:bifunctional DNA primase/polymerase-like protein [Haloactinospora alba]